MSTPRTPSEDRDSPPSSMFNMHGIINLDAVSTLLTQIIKQIEKQNDAITQIQMKLPNYLTIHAFEEKIHSMELFMQKLESKINVVHKATTCYIKDKELTSAELATSNYHLLQTWGQFLKNCISRKEVEKQYQEVLDLKETNNRLRNDIARILKITDQLNEGQIHMNDKLHVHEENISCKLDKSELNHLQSLVAKILLYDEFKNQTLITLDEFRAYRITTDETLIQHEEETKKIQENLLEITEEVSKKAHKRDVHVLAKELKKHSDWLEKLAYQSSLDDAFSMISQLAKRLKETQEDLIDVEKDLEQVHKVVETKESIEEVKKCLRTETFDRATMILNEQLESKTSLIYSEHLQTQINHVEEWLAEESRKATVALKFVEWFTERGENYEHNMKIIDRHLKDLVASEKYPRVHTYYLPGNRVEFGDKPTSTTPNYHITKDYSTPNIDSSALNEGLDLSLNYNFK